MEFDSEEDLLRYEKGRYYSCLLAILNMVEMIIIYSVNSGAYFFLIIPFQLFLNIGLAMGKKPAYTFSKYLGFGIGAIGAYSVIYHLATPYFWMFLLTEMFLISIYMVLYNAWAMYLIRKEYIAYYVEMKSDAYNWY